MEVAYTAGFVRMLKVVSEDLRREVLEKISLFRDPNNHDGLKVHKLRGRLKGRYGFSVNYKIRIVFTYLNTKPKEALLLAIGDHDIYKA